MKTVRLGIVPMLVLMVILAITLASSPQVANAQITCRTREGTCPAEFYSCERCSGGYRNKYRNYDKYRCTDGSYICLFTAYSYGPCGTCYY